jgi:hypothetical protein
VEAIFAVAEVSGGKYWFNNRIRIRRLYKEARGWSRVAPIHFACGTKGSGQLAEFPPFGQFPQTLAVCRVPLSGTILRKRSVPFVWRAI